jgi:branched-chain amino acid transport system ATP-binding protein
MNSSNEIILKVEQLNVYYNGIHAIKNFSFHVLRNEIVSLIGANGAGKTTALKAISGLIESTGKIIFEGAELSDLKAHERVSVGVSLCPEGRGVFPTLTVMENLLIGAHSRKATKHELDIDIEKSFQLFPRLKERAKQFAGNLSGGEQQMLAICRALMAKPELLMLDEPSLGLAPMVVSQIFQIIQTLNQSGTTILLVEQNARMALKICSRAYVIETGVCTLEGLGKDLLQNDDVRKSYLGG